MNTITDKINDIVAWNNTNINKNLSPNTRCQDNRVLLFVPLLDEKTLESIDWCLLYNKHIFCYVNQWLQDVIALQCSIMRHLCIKQKALSTEWEYEQKTNSKTFETSEDKKTQAYIGRTSPGICSKLSSTPDDPQISTLSRDNPAEVDVSKCSMTPCQNCIKSSGPHEGSQPSKANVSVVCNSDTDCCRQADLPHRVKPTTTPLDSPPTSTLVNHINTETVKKEPESSTGTCTERNCPTAPTIRPHHSQQNHKDKMEIQEEGMSSDEKPSYSVTSSAQSDTPSSKCQEQGSSSPPAKGTCLNNKGIITDEHFHFWTVNVKPSV